MKMLLAGLMAVTAIAVTAPIASAQPYGPGPGYRHDGWHHHGYGYGPGWHHGWHRHCWWRHGYRVCR